MQGARSDREEIPIPNAKAGRAVAQELDDYLRQGGIYLLDSFEGFFFLVQSHDTFFFLPLLKWKGKLRFAQNEVQIPY